MKNKFKLKIDTDYKEYLKKLDNKIKINKLDTVTRLDEDLNTIRRLSTSYDVYDEKGNVLITRRNTSCFSHLFELSKDTFNLNFKKGNELHIYVAKSDIINKPHEINFYLKSLKRAGLKFTKYSRKNYVLTDVKGNFFYATDVKDFDIYVIKLDPEKICNIKLTAYYIRHIYELDLYVLVSLFNIYKKKFPYQSTISVIMALESAMTTSHSDSSRKLYGLIKKLCINKAESLRTCHLTSGPYFSLKKVPIRKIINEIDKENANHRDELNTLLKKVGKYTGIMKVPGYGENRRSVVVDFDINLTLDQNHKNTIEKPKKGFESIQVENF